jgi:hypothetical protein
VGLSENPPGCSSCAAQPSDFVERLTDWYVSEAQYK